MWLRPASGFGAFRVGLVSSLIQPQTPQDFAKAPTAPKSSTQQDFTNSPRRWLSPAGMTGRLGPNFDLVLKTKRVAGLLRFRVEGCKGFWGASAERRKLLSPASSGLDDKARVSALGEGIFTSSRSSYIENLKVQGLHIVVRPSCSETPSGVARAKDWGQMK